MSVRLNVLRTRMSALLNPVRTGISSLRNSEFGIRTSLGGSGLRTVFRLLFLLLLTFAALNVPAQGVLSSLQYRIVGTQLRVTPAIISVPKGVAGSVLVQLVNGQGTTNGVDLSLGQGAHVEAILRGPSFPARRLVGRVNEPLMLPPLNLVGDYRLDGIRLVDTASGVTRLEGTPASVPVGVFDQVLISKVTSRPLSVQEIADKGIVIDENNFRAVEFEVGFVLDGQRIPVKFPVVSPTFTQSTEIIPLAELQKRLVDAQRINDELSRAVLDSGELPPELQRPGLNIQIKGANFELVGDQNKPGLRLGIPPIPALMVIPGNIGYLNQFFSVQIFTENGAPAHSGLSVYNVTAKLNLPPGPDGLRSTNYTAPGDDPLRFARVGQSAQTFELLPLTGPAPDRLIRFQPGQGGTAEFLVEGLQEGLHIMDLDLAADLDGLAAGTVKIAGKASGSVLVRNPKFSLSFSHPKTVRSGEPYNAHVTILNTGNVDANFVSVTLPGASLSGGVLQSSEVVQLGNIAPGQSATATFRVLAQRTGSIKFSNLTTGESSVQGRFNLTMGIDERGVELSPDTMTLPDFVNYIPQSVLDAANRILGQALSAATAPLLPAGVKPVGRGTITRRALELAEAGQRLKYMESTNRVLMDLMLDWQGGRSAYDEGFDQILRTTEAGRQFRAVLLAAAEAEDNVDVTLRLLQHGPDFAGRGESWVLASSSSPHTEAGAVLGDNEATFEHSALPRATVYAGERGSLLVSRVATNLVRWSVRTNTAQADLAVLVLGTNGIGRQLRWSVQNLAAGTCLSFDPASGQESLFRDDNCDGTPDASLLAAAADVHELPPMILTVLQDIDVSVSRPFFRCTPGPANNYGQVLALLFSKPMLQTNAAIPSAYKLDNGITASGVQVQPGGRVALISMREGVSAIRPRMLTVEGITDPRGNPVTADPQPVFSNFRDGVAVNGRVLRADGTPAVGVPVTVTMYDPWKDPFDRCDPVIVTRTSQEYTDTNGLFSFDFVHAGVGFTIAAVDTGGLTVEAIDSILKSTVGDRFAAEKLAALAAATNALAQLGVASVDDAVRLIEGLDRAVWSDRIDFNAGRVGQEITVGLRFRGRAIVSGTVLASDGVTPVPNAAINLFPDPDSREQARGKFTDANGRFEFTGVPLGQFTASVKTGQGHFRTVAGNLTAHGETNDLTIVLTPPVREEIVRTSVQGRVVEPDNVTPHPQAKVFISAGPYGVVGAVTTDEAGFWKIDDIPAGPVNIKAFSSDGRRKAESRGNAVTNSVAFILTTLTGTGTVVGRVETSAGVPVANAIIAGGETLVRTDTNGFFRTTGVPQGNAKISAGLEARYAPGGFPRIGSASVNVLPDIDNVAVIRLPAVGQIIGRVTDANGEPITGKNVAIPLPEQKGFAWVRLDENGRFTFPNMGLGDYIVSAPAPPVQEKETDELLEELRTAADDQIAAALKDAVTAVSQSILRRLGDAPPVTPGSFGWTRTSVTYDGETAQANFSYLPEGKVTGMVMNDQGVPIGAAVRLTGPGLDDYGSPTTVIIGTRDSDPASGEFSFSRLPQGSWALQTASPFYPVVVVTNGVTTRFALDLTNVVLAFPPIKDVNGRLAGSVFYPDGTPATNVNVKINFSQDYVIRTDSEGQFDTQMKIPARTYLLEAHDPATGLRGQASAQVKAGITNYAVVHLLGKGSLRLLVKQADGSPAVGASVIVNQSSFPGDDYNAVTDSSGVFQLNNIFVGKYGLKVSYLTGSARLDGNVGAEVQLGKTAEAELTLGPTGTIRGIFRNRDDGTPIVAARVSIGNAAFPSTDTNGAFNVSGLALGTYRVTAREPVSGRLAVATAMLTYNGQVLDVNLTQLSQGELRGMVYQAGENGGIAGAELLLRPRDGLSPVVSVTSGPDGSFAFPGLTTGQYTLEVRKSYSRTEYYSRVVTVDFPDNTPVHSVDVTLPSRTVYGTITVQVFEPGGTTPATNATVNDFSTDPNGRVVFENLRLGSHTFRARSTTTNQTSSAAVVIGTLSETRTNITLEVTLSGVGRLRGRVLDSGGTNGVLGATVRLHATSYPSNNVATGVIRDALALTDSNGEFTIENLPVGPFEVSAVSGALASSASGAITNGGQTEEITLRLGASGTVTGRLFRADRVTPVGGNQVSVTFKAPSGLNGISTSVTDQDGRFRFELVPAGEITFTASRLAVNGLAKKKGVLASNGQELDLGDIYLHEDWPFVTSVLPETGAQGISTTARVEIAFSELIATNSIFTNGIYLRSDSSVVPATLAWEPPTNGGTRLIWLTPKTPLASLTTYRLFVLAGEVEDGLGRVIGRGPLSLVERPLLTPYTSSFTTRDDDPPRIVSLYPTNNAEKVEPVDVVRISFNEPLLSSNVVARLTGPSGIVEGQLAFGFNDTVLTFAPVRPLVTNSRYTFSLNGVRDTAHNAMTNQPLVVAFDTLDTAGPTLSELRLADGQRPTGGVPADLEAVLQTAEPGVTVKFTADGNNIGLATNSPYRVRITLPVLGSIVYRAVATDRFGNDGAVKELPLTVVAAEAPTVVLLKGAPGNAPVPTGSSFSASVGATGDAPITNVLVSITGPTNVTLNLRSGVSTNLTFRVPSDALPGTVVIVRARATDALGAISPEATISWPVVDGTPPSIAWLSPTQDAVLDLSRPLEIRLRTFDNATNLHILAVTDGGLVSTNEFNLAIDQNLQQTNAFQLALTNAIRSGANLNVRLTIMDPGTNTVSLQRRFVLPDIAPPRLLAVSPTNGASKLGLWDVYRDFPFSERLPAQSISTNLFAVASDAPGEITGHSLVDFSDGTVRVRFNSPLRPGTTYTNVLRPEIADAAANRFVDANGNPLPDGTNFTLSTAAILSVAPTNQTPVWGGDRIRVDLTYERELGARYFRFALNGAQQSTVQVSSSTTNAGAEFLVPLDTTNLVISAIASDDFAFSEPRELTPITLHFMGNRSTNQAPSVQIVRVNPSTGGVAPGQVFTVRLQAADDFGVTNLTLVAAGPVTTNAVFGPATNVTVNLAVPTNATPNAVIQLLASARDAGGLMATSRVDIPVLEIRYPYPAGTLFYSRGPAASPSIWALEPSGGAEAQVTSGSYPVISPNGRYLAFKRGSSAEFGRNDIFVRDLATGQEKPVANESGQWIYSYSWLNDSTNLLFDYSCELARVRWDGSDRVRFNNVHCWNDAPAVNPVDGRVAVHNITSAQADNGLWIISADGQQRVRVPNTTSADTYPRWSQDGEWLAFISGGNVFKIRPDGYDRTQLTFAQGEAFAPGAVWSVDGAQLLAAGTVQGTNAIWTIAADGSGATLFKSQPGEVFAHVGSLLAPVATGPLPLLVATTPSAGSTNNSLWTTNVVLAFSRAISLTNLSTNTVTFSGVRYDVALSSSGQGQTNAGSSRILIRPTLPLAPGVAYDAGITSGLRDLSGRPVPASNVVFSTARIRSVEPFTNTVVFGGQYIDAAVEFDSGLGAKFFTFGLNSNMQAQVPVPEGATRVTAPLLVPLSTSNLVLTLVASTDAAMTVPYVLPPVPLIFGGNSGTNALPLSQLTLTSPANGQVLPGSQFSVLASASSEFGITNLVLNVSGAVSASRSFTNGGPFALSFGVPLNAAPGSTITVNSSATDALGVVSSNATAQVTVAAPPAPLAPGTILYSRAGNPQGEIWSVRLDGSADQFVASGDQPRISPDNRFLLLGRDKDNPSQKNIYVRELQTGLETLLFAHNDFVVLYDWTLDSSRVIFDYQCGISTVDRDGANYRQVISGNCYDDSPTVNPVDGRVAWQNDRTGNGIFLANADLSGRALVTNTIPGDWNAEWSPDGLWLSFYRSTTKQVFKIRPDGTGLALLTPFDLTYGAGTAVWTPDGTRVVFAASIQGTNGIFTVPTDGSGTLTRIPTSPGAAIEAVTSIVLPASTVEPAPVLLTVAPANNAAKQSLWPSTVTFDFSAPLNPASVLPSRFAIQTSNGPVPFTTHLAPDGRQVRLLLNNGQALVPATVYTNRILPGLVGANGQPVAIADPAVFTFATARLLAFTPTNNAPVIAGQVVNATATFDPELGAQYARFRLESRQANNTANPAVVEILPAAMGKGSVIAALGLPASAASATLHVELADSLAFERAVAFAPVSLAVTPLGSTLQLALPPQLALIVGDTTNLLVTASAPSSPIEFLGPVSVLPPFVAYRPASLTNQPTSGSGGFTLLVDAASALPGTYNVAVAARAISGGAVTNQLAITVSPNPGLAVTRWKDAVNGNWSDAARWTAGVPGPSLPAVIDVPGTYTVSLTADANIGSLTMGGPSGTQTLDLSTRALRFQSSAVLGSNTLVRLGSFLGGSGFISLAGQVQWTSGGFEAGGPVSVLPGSQIVITNTSEHYLPRPLHNSGRIVWHAGNLRLDLGGSVGMLVNNPDGVFEWRGDNTLTSGTLLNRGLIEKNGGVKNPAQFSTTVNSALRNEGILRLNSGGLSLRGASESLGRFEIATNTMLSFENATHILGPGSRVLGDGDLQFYSGTTEVRGAYELVGETYVRGTALFHADAEIPRLRLTGSLSGPGQVFITRTLDWPSGSFDPGGLAVLGSNAVATLDTTGVKYLQRTLNNEGRIDFLNGTIQFEYNGNPGTLNNAPGALLQVLGNARINFGALNNYGEIVRDGAVGNPADNLALLNTQLRNDGSVSVESGTLELRSSTATGVYEVNTNAILVFNGNHLLAAAGEIRGGGDVQFQGNSSALFGNYAVSGTTRVTGTVRFHQPTPVLFPSLILAGTLGGTADIVIGDSWLWQSGTAEQGGSFHILPGAAATLATTGDKYLLRLLDNEGVISWEAGVLHLDYNFNSGTLRNRPNATFLIGGDLRSQSGRIINEGLLRKTAGLGVANIRTHLQNSGVLFADSGALQFEEGGQHRGSFNIAESARITFSGGQHYLRDGAVIAGPGLFTTSGNAGVYFDSGAVLSAGFGSANGTVYFNPGSRPDLRGKSIDINGTVVFNSGAAHRIGTLNLSGTLDGSDQVLADTSFNWASGSIQGAGVKGTSAGAALNISGGSDKGLYGTLQNGGTAVWSAGRIYAFPTGKLRNLANASFELRGDLRMDWGSFVNEGQLLRSAGSGAAAFNNTVFDNAGTVRNQVGTLSFEGGGTQTGIFNADPGARLAFAGTHSFAATSAVLSQGSASLGGTISFLGKLDVATLDIPGSVQFRTGAVLNVSVPAVNLSGTAAFNSGGPVTFTTLNLTGTLDGSDTVTVANTLNWTSGNVQGSGRLIAGPQAALTISGGPDKGLYGTLENRGSAVWSAGRIYAFPNGKFVNSGSFEARGDLRMDWGSFQNDGAFAHTTGTNTATFAGGFSNSGTVTNLSGTMAMTGGGSQSGPFHTVASTRLNFAGTQSFATNSAVVGPGTVALGGTVTYAGLLDVQGPVDLTGAVTFTAGAVPRLAGRTVNITGSGVFNTGLGIEIGSVQLNGTLNGGDQVTVTNSLHWVDGSIQGAGLKRTSVGATLVLSGTGDKSLQGTLENGGTATWNGGRIYAYPEGLLRNAASGQLTVSGGTRMDWGTLENLGLLVKAAPTNTLDLNILVNSGTFDVDSGLLAVHGASTNSGALTINTNATLRFDGQRIAMETGAHVAGPGTLLLADSVQLLLGTDVFFGDATVRFAGSSSVAGNFRMSNGPGGLFYFGRSMTVPGSITIGGALEIGAANITLTVTRNLTLLAGGTILNPGTIRAGEFDNTQGGTVNGNAPIEIGLPPGGQFRIVSLSLAPPTGPQQLSLNPGQVRVTWVSDVQSGFRVQSSTDLLNWRDHATTPRSLGDGRFEATLDIGSTSRCFFRVLSR